MTIVEVSSMLAAQSKILTNGIFFIFHSSFEFIVFELSAKQLNPGAWHAPRISRFNP